MQQIEAANLYEGAVILLDEVRPARVIRIIRKQPGEKIAVALQSTADNALSTVELYQPEDTVRLCSVPSVHWSIHHGYRDPKTGATRGSYVSTPIGPVYCVRDHWAYTAGHQVVSRLVEHHTVTTYVPISLNQLPGEGRPTERPANPGDSRFYRLNKVGPYVLRTGDDVRQLLAKIADVHDREHGRRDARNNRLAPLYPPHECSRCVSGPHDLDPVEVTITRTERDIQLSDLPQDWDYALGPAMAHARITAAADRDQAQPTP
ncbi:hypothetical protein ACFXB3_35320 [Streptomyces sp. NPDC059447]|uniref:hypothetical protein n=1 Tax=Streptomyces sp. NPDC059447 TaxID=3346834 RepID=UPI0036B5F40B